MKVIEKNHACLVEEVITFFFSRSQRNNAFIFSEMTQFVLWYAPLNVSVGTLSPCIVSPCGRCSVIPLINLSPDHSLCKTTASGLLLPITTNERWQTPRPVVPYFSPTPRKSQHRVAAAINHLLQVCVLRTPTLGAWRGIGWTPDSGQLHVLERGVPYPNQGHLSPAPCT